MSVLLNTYIKYEITTSSIQFSLYLFAQNMEIPAKQITSAKSTLVSKHYHLCWLAGKKQRSDHCYIHLDSSSNVAQGNNHADSAQVLGYVYMWLEDA